jgi:hypothetical protein
VLDDFALYRRTGHELPDLSNKVEFLQSSAQLADRKIFERNATPKAVH